MDLTTYTLLLQLLTNQIFSEEVPPQKLKQLNNMSRHYFVIDQELYKKGRKNNPTPLRVIKRAEVPSILEAMHSDLLAGHFGFDGTYQRIIARYFWPQMGEDIKEYVKTCAVCQRRGSRVRKEPLYPIKVGNPFDRIGIDFVGPLPMTRRRNQYIVVATDYLTKWPEAKAVPNAQAVSAASFIYEEIICRHGCPKEILSDQGKHFCNELVDSLCQFFDIKHTLSSAYHPQTNGLVERFNRTLCEALAKYVDAYQTEWDLFIPSVLFAYRTLTHATTKYEPFTLVYGRQATLPIEFQTPTYQQPASQDFQQQLLKRVTHLTENLPVQRSQARKNIQQAQNEWRERINSSSDKYKPLRIGDQVLKYKSAVTPGQRNKFAVKWEGPYYVHQVLQNGAYYLRDQKGRVTRTSVHGSQLKLYHAPSM